MSEFWIKMQASVNSLDEGVTRLVLRVILFLCLGVALAGGFAWSQFRGLSSPEAMEYAQLGRNIAEGQGFVTSCIRPVDFRQLGINAESKAEISALPELRKGPIYPLLLAFGFNVKSPSFATPSGGKLFAPEAKVILPTGIVFFLLTALIVFFIATKLFNHKVAILSMILTLVNGALLSFSISGTPIPVVVFLMSAIVLVLLYAIYAVNTKRSPKLWGGLLALAGILCGSAFLTLYEMFAILPMIILWLWFSLDQKRFSAIGILVVVFILCIAPWMIRNQAVAGSPFGLAPSQVIHDTYMYAGDSYDREISPELSNSITAMGIKNRFKVNLSQVLNKNMGLGGLGIIGAFFLVSLLSRSEHHEKDLLKWLVLAGLAFMVIVVGLCGIGSLNMMLVFFPVMIIFGTAFFCEQAARLTNYMEEYEAAPGAILIFIASLPVLLTIVSTRGSIPYPPYYPPLISYVTSMLEDNEMLCSDIPWATAWYGNQTSVLIPTKVGDLETVNDFGWRCSGIYLADKSAAGKYLEDRSWQALRNKEIPEDFILKHGINLPPGSKDQLFLTDSTRWSDDNNSLVPTEGAE